MIEQVDLNLGGRRVRVYSSGQENGRPPLVLLHGGGTDSALLSWRLALPALGTVRKVYAPDWPGYGGSDPLSVGATMQGQLAWLEELLDRMVSGPVALAGISMGGGGALGYTLAHPQRVERLALIDSYGLQRKVAYHRLSRWMVNTPGIMDWSWNLARRSKSVTRATLGQLFADPRHISPELLDEVFDAVQSPGGQSSFGQLQRDEILPDGLKTCYMDRLAEIKCPVLIVHGEKDGQVPVADAREAAGRIGGARLEIIANAAHWAMREQPQAFERIMLSFFG